MYSGEHLDFHFISFHFTYQPRFYPMMQIFNCLSLDYKNLANAFKQKNIFQAILVISEKILYQSCKFHLTERFFMHHINSNDEIHEQRYLVHENLTFLWCCILRWEPRSVETNASMCNTLSSNKLCPKGVRILVFKGLRTFARFKTIWISIEGSP